VCGRRSTPWSGQQSEEADALADIGVDGGHLEDLLPTVHEDESALPVRRILAPAPTQFELLEDSAPATQVESRSRGVTLYLCHLHLPWLAAFSRGVERSRCQAGKESNPTTPQEELCKCMAHAPAVMGDAAHATACRRSRSRMGRQKDCSTHVPTSSSGPIFGMQVPRLLASRRHWPRTRSTVRRWR
jgi:hypothetical protein